MQIRRLALLSLGAAASFGLASTTAEAAASSERVTVQRGQWARAGQGTCAPSTVTIPVRHASASGFSPAAGEELEGDDGDAAWTVANVQTGPGNATWTLTPGPSCESTDPASEWRFAYALRVRKHVVRTTSGEAVRSVGGFGMANATIKAARRKLGRPSRVRSSGRQVCTVTWRKIGLKIVFVNWGGNNACQHGFAQSASISRAHLWAVRVGDRPAITSESSIADLVASELAERVKGGWQLDSYYNMIGEEGYFPLVVARARNARSPITGFDVWLGRGGD